MSDYWRGVLVGVLAGISATLFFLVLVLNIRWY